MDEKTKSKLKTLLTEQLENWLMNDELDAIEFPWLGENVASIMATAALAVLEGMADSHNYLRRDGMLKDGKRG